MELCEQKEVYIGSSLHEIPIQGSAVFYIQLNLTIGIPSILQFLFQVGALQLWQRHVQQEGREDIIRYLQEYSGKGHEQVENLNIIDEYEQGEAGKLKMIDDFGQEQVGNLNILKFRGRYETLWDVKFKSVFIIVGGTPWHLVNPCT